MNKFYRTLSPKDENALWKSDLKWWIVENKEIAPVTDSVLKEWDEKLNSDSPDMADVKSFCQLTGWQYGTI